VGIKHPPDRGKPREAETAIRIEVLHGFHEPYVALLDEILEGQTVAAVLLGHRDNQPETISLSRGHPF